MDRQIEYELGSWGPRRGSWSVQGTNFSCQGLNKVGWGMKNMGKEGKAPGTQLVRKMLLYVHTCGHEVDIE